MIRRFLTADKVLLTFEQENPLKTRNSINAKIFDTVRSLSFMFANTQKARKHLNFLSYCEEVEVAREDLILSAALAANRLVTGEPTILNRRIDDHIIRVYRTQDWVSN